MITRHRFCQVAIALALCGLWAACAAAQDGLGAGPPAGPATPGLPTAVPAPASPGGWPVPAAPCACPTPTPWPPPCVGSPCDPCEVPLKSLCPDKCDFYLLPPRLNWYAVADVALLRRDPSHDTSVASLNNPGNIVLSTGNFDYPFDWTGRLLVGHTCNECWQVEAVYMAVSEDDNFRGVRDATPNALGGQGNLFSPFSGFGDHPVPGLDYNNLAQMRYLASLQSGEAYIRRKLPMPPERLSSSILFGARYVAIPEKFQYLTQSAVPGPGVATNSIEVDTDNRMLGPEVGAAFEFYAENRWWVNVEVKGAMLDNRARQETDYTNVDSAGATHQYSNSRAEHHTTFLGDLALTLEYRWTPHFTTRLGYQALFFNNLALAPNNLDTNIQVVTGGPAQLHYRGNTIYHGPFAGVMVGW